MRRFAFGLLVGSVFGLVSCGESKPKTTPKDSGGDTATDAGGDAVPMCKGTFAFANRMQLGDRANSAGKCATSADLDVICDNDVGGRVRALGIVCFGNNPMGGEQALAACTLTALKGDNVPDPTDACYSCYLAATGCTLANCRNECAADATAPACLSCQLNKGCLSAFYSCSGLPLPPGLSIPDGGAPDAAGDTAPEAAADRPAETAGETAAETSSETPPATDGATETSTDGAAAETD